MKAKEGKAIARAKSSGECASSAGKPASLSRAVQPAGLTGTKTNVACTASSAEQPAALGRPGSGRFG